MLILVLFDKSRLIPTPDFCFILSYLSSIVPLYNIDIYIHFSLITYPAFRCTQPCDVDRRSDRANTEKKVTLSSLSTVKRGPNANSAKRCADARTLIFLLLMRSQMPCSETFSYVKEKEIKHGVTCICNLFSMVAAQIIQKVILTKLFY